MIKKINLQVDLGIYNFLTPSIGDIFQRFMDDGLGLNAGIINHILSCLVAEKIIPRKYQENGRGPVFVICERIKNNYAAMHRKKKIS